MQTIARLVWTTETGLSLKDFQRAVNRDLDKADVKIWGSGGWPGGWGNGVLFGLPLEWAEKLADKYNATYDMVRPILEHKDLEGLNPGDRITYHGESMLANMTTCKGTVHAVETAQDGTIEVVIRPYRARKYGIRIREGEIGRVEKGWR